MTSRSASPPRRALGGLVLLLPPVVALVLLASVFLGACSADGPASDSTSGSLAPGSARVSRVVDGDTLVVDLAGTSERVRLIGIDTPETKSPSKPVQCFGKEASDDTAELLPAGTVVRLERDVEERDQYGRLLAYVYRADDDLFVNEALARDGFASLLTYPPNVAHVDVFRRAVDDARARQAGLWVGAAVPASPPAEARAARRLRHEQPAG